MENLNKDFIAYKPLTDETIASLSNDGKRRGLIRKGGTWELRYYED